VPLGDFYLDVMPIVIVVSAILALLVVFKRRIQARRRRTDDGVSPVAPEFSTRHVNGYGGAGYFRFQSGFFIVGGLAFCLAGKYFGLALVAFGCLSFVVTEKVNPVLARRRSERLARKARLAR
jgi:hypothetical protein